MFTNELDQLYQRLEHYQLDDPTHEFGFTRHLIKNHGWTEKYAYRAISEYKKFVFLTVVAEHQIVPSDTVDQVWHAHLLLTKSYWDEFCPQILGRKLHHHPARGGKEERADFHQLYRQTIGSYRQYFGKPPLDIWSPPEIRFGKELKMQRFNKIDNWIISKNLLQKNLVKLTLIIRVVLCVLTITSMQKVFASNTSEVTSFDYSRDWSYSLVPAFIGLLIRHKIRQPKTQSQKPVLNEYEIAYLAGGEKRAVELAITKLVYQGYLRSNARNRTFAIAKAYTNRPYSIELQTMNQVLRTPEFKELRTVEKYKVDNLRVQLEGHQLLIEQNLVIAVRWSITLLFFAFCGAVSEALNSLGSQVNYLWLGILIMLINLIIPGDRTYWGDRVLKDIRKQDTGFDPIQRFALYGESTLSGGALDDLKQIYKAQHEDDTGGCGCGC